MYSKMSKEQFLKLVKIKGKINYLNRLKAEAENNPKQKPTVKADKQDYMKAAGQILGEMVEEPKKTVSLSGEEYLKVASVAKSFYDKGRTETLPQFVIFMGGVASGKTTIRRHDYAEGYVHFDLAEIHAVLKKAVGENNPKLGAYVDTVADMILTEAFGQKKNIVTEIIGDNYQAIAPIMDNLTKIGYKVSVNSILADPVESYQRHLKAVKEDPDYLSAHFTEEATLAHLNHHFS